jgi:hypothetical protein
VVPWNQEVDDMRPSLGEALAMATDLAASTGDAPSWPARAARPISLGFSIVTA